MSPRDKPKADNLAKAIASLSEGASNYATAVTSLLRSISERDHRLALTGYQAAHALVLLNKDALNALYRHLSELKPAPDAAAKDRKAAKAATREARKTVHREVQQGKAPPKGRPVGTAPAKGEGFHGEVTADEPTDDPADEPTDEGDPDAP
jgi:hypothetical protein